MCGSAKRSTSYAICASLFVLTEYIFQTLPGKRVCSSNLPERRHTKCVPHVRCELLSKTSGPTLHVGFSVEALYTKWLKTKSMCAPLKRLRHGYMFKPLCSLWVYVSNILASNFKGGLFLSNISTTLSWVPSNIYQSKASCEKLFLEANATKAIHMILMCSSVKGGCQKSHVKPSPLFLKTSQSPSQTLAELADVAGKPADLSLKFSGTQCIQNQISKSLMCSSVKKG